MPQDIDRHQVQAQITQGAQLVEVLPVEEYTQEHLPGAINIPLKTLDAARVQRLAHDRPVVVYCHDNQ